METKQTTRTQNQEQEVVQQIELVKGCFTPSEAFDIINNLIDEKINFHKLQRLRDSEGNHFCDTQMLDGRIGELAREKEIARDYINDIRSRGKNLKISGTLSITLED